MSRDAFGRFDEIDRVLGRVLEADESTDEPMSWSVQGMVRSFVVRSNDSSKAGRAPILRGRASRGVQPR